MALERAKRHAASGLPPLIPGPLPDLPPATVDGVKWEDMTLAQQQAYQQSFAGYWNGDATPYGHWNWERSSRYWPLGAPENLYDISLRQVQADDAAEKAGTPFTLLKTEDGISPYSPSRLAQVDLEENMAALRSQEEETVRLLSQTLSPSEVAEISSSQSTTDPIGRLLLCALAQQAAHTAEIGTLPAPTGVQLVTAHVQPPTAQPGAPPQAMSASAGTDAARLGVVPAMSDVPPPAGGISQAGIVQDTGGGSPVLFWALAIGGLLYSLSTGKKKVQVF